MSTPCGNPDPHQTHVWAIEANPGEDGPDWFQCNGRTVPYVWTYAPGPGGYPLGRVDTSDWPTA